MHNLTSRVTEAHRIVKARQANHYSFRLPGELSDYKENALYRYIARWSYIRRAYICCDDVAASFGISVRQATNILSMIHRRYGDVISCDIKRTKSGKGNIIKTHLLVTEIKEFKRCKKVKKASASRDDNTSEAMCLKQLRDNFLFCKKKLEA
ncbi:MAG: CaiF/GrlA family transcriptional regulator [Kluyvera sp.]|uniref:CaiF/GrlA family transcriptional regulator n=1 Tax=Kluyvera sp. TaxID=1538228 RepID=UPI003F348A78